MDRFSLARLFVEGVLAVLLGAMCGCNNPSRDVLGMAYVAPASINLRRELSDKNNSVAVLKHGETVQILEVRRRFVKVRTKGGAQGWIDSFQLLTPGQMSQIRKEAQIASELPSQGSATVFEALNIHLEPSRQSPAFARIPETGSVEVLAHKLQAKVTGPPPTAVFTFAPSQPDASRQARRAKRLRDNFRIPRKPLPPKAPENWLDLSGQRAADVAARLASKKQLEKTPDEPKKPLIMEDWSLVRTKDKQCGWVLSRNLIMSIPDEVAQYAEGKRITSYFNLGAIEDEEKGTKHNWLWTTASQPLPFDFDGWRVFIWNRKRHRYETSYRERDVEGYFPVHVDPPEASAPDAGTSARTFQLVMRDDDGKLWRRGYSFDGMRVHLVGKGPDTPGVPVTPQVLQQQTARKMSPGWFGREWGRLKRRLTGG